MNIFYKLYCRIYQSVLRIALPFLPYRTPEILASADEIGDLLMKNAPGLTLIVTDRGCREAGLLKILTDALDRSGQRYVIFDGVVSNPTTETVENARRIFIENRCSSLIGLGGGSSMDCAKAAGARIARPDRQMGQMRGILKVRKKIPYLISVPTTAGTGSETTLAAVITDAETRHKYAVNDFPLIPSAAVLDPEFTKSLPKKMTACTGMDALTHAVEAYIGRSTTEQTRAWAVKAVQLIFSNLIKAYDDGENMKARSNMMQAAFYAGASFSQSYVGYVHAVAHSLGGRYNIPHGLANAVLLPVVLECYGTVAQRKLHELAVYAGISSPDESDAAGSEKFICAVRAMNRRLGIPQTLPGIKEKDIPEMARYADMEANPLYPVPVIWGADQLERFYYAVMEGEKVYDRVSDRSADLVSAQAVQ